jgi:very-short-patch-repair endonuclease
MQAETGIGEGRGIPVVRGQRHQGREPDIRCACKLNGRVQRKQTLRVTTHFCRVASAAKVGGEPIVTIRDCSAILSGQGLCNKLKWKSGKITLEKTAYIIRSLSKISSKRWEHYVINRLYHRLNDPEIEFICQQCIRKADGRVYLVDLYFPQFKLYLEVDEVHHESDAAVINDARRRFDIAEASGLTEKRISTVEKSIEAVDAEVEVFLTLLQSLKAEADAFLPWDYESRFKPKIHIDMGYIEIGPYSAFRYQKDALSCFGYEKGHYQRGVWNLPPEICEEIGLNGKCMVWFPRLYEQKNWNNSLSDDGLTIREKSKNPDHSYAETWDARIVMARTRDSLNRTLYHFVGVFRVLPEYRAGNDHRFERISTNVKTLSR